MSDDKNTFRSTEEDDALVADLRALAAAHDPVPPEAVAAARSALAWRTMDAELAELVADSLAGSGDLALVRSTDTPTLLTFESSELTVEVEVLLQNGRRRLLGQLVPGGQGVVEVRHKGGTVSVSADEVGLFRVDEVAAGPVSLRCTSGSRVVDTDWFLV